MIDVCYQLIKWSALAYGSVVASAVKANDSLAGGGVFAFLENASTRELLRSEELRIDTEEIFVSTRNKNSPVSVQKRCFASV